MYGKSSTLTGGTGLYEIDLYVISNPTLEKNKYNSGEKG